MIEVVAVLDRSGSMAGDEKNVIDAYNEFINKQKSADYKCNVTLVLFDDQYEEVYNSRPIHEVQSLCEHVYFTRGMTALNDAIGKTINRFKNSKNVFFFVETDGFENASKEFKGKQVKRMIEDKQRNGWEFTFVGADLTKEELESMSKSFGININNTLNFDKSVAGYSSRNAFVSDTLSTYASTVEDKESKDSLQTP